MLTSMGHDHYAMQQKKHRVVQGPNVSNIQHQNPLVMHATYQQQTQHPQHLLKQNQVGPNVSNIKHTQNPLDMYAIYK